MGYFSEIFNRKPYPKNVLGAYDKGRLGKFIWLFDSGEKSHFALNYTQKNMPFAELEEAVDYALEYIEKREDCADFVALQLLHILLVGDFEAFKKFNFGKLKDKIRDALLEFPYWLGEGDIKSMCLHSENHQVICAVCEAILFERFGNAKNSVGAERLGLWLGLKLSYGYSEFYSENYYPLCATALAVYLRFGKDEALKSRAKSALDLLFYDVALQGFDGTLGGVQGRAYVRNLTHSPDAYADSFKIIFDYLFLGKRLGATYRYSNWGYMFISAVERGFYTLSPEIIKVYRERNLIVTTSDGLDLKEAESACLTSMDLQSRMLMLGMGGLTNPQVIDNSLNTVKKYGLWKNAFFCDFAIANCELLQKRRRLRRISEKINLFTNGMALERRNVYTFRRMGYKLSSLCKYKPGTGGAQLQTMGLTLRGGVNIYTMHPLCKGEYTKAGGYFAGYGVAPDCVQHENICMMIHKIPAFLVGYPHVMPGFTHTFLPKALLDVVISDGRFVFFRKGRTFGAIIGCNPLVYKPFDSRIIKATNGMSFGFEEYDLIQKGRNQYTIYELSSEDAEDFGSFVTRIKTNHLTFDGNTLTYTSQNVEYKNEYKGGFYIQGVAENLVFARYDSKFGFTEAGDRSVRIGSYNIDII